MSRGQQRAQGVGDPIPSQIRDPECGERSEADFTVSSRPSSWCEAAVAVGVNRHRRVWGFTHKRCFKLSVGKERVIVRLVPALTVLCLVLL